LCGKGNNGNELGEKDFGGVEESVNSKNRLLPIYTLNKDGSKNKMQTQQSKKHKRIQSKKEGT